MNYKRNTVEYIFCSDILCVLDIEILRRGNKECNFAFSVSKIVLKLGIQLINMCPIEKWIDQ